MPDIGAELILADTITKLPLGAANSVVLSGSHGGRYPGYLAARAGLRALVSNDAGIGRDEAGIGSLPYLDALEIAAAAVSHGSARIGDAADLLARGIVSGANAVARACGLETGMACREAAQLLLALAPPPRPGREPPSVGEGRAAVTIPGATRPLHLLDSAAMVEPSHAGTIVVTGSHGGLIGGSPALALRTDAFAAVFNDAGIGADEAGVTRLPALDERGIAAFTVAAASARIGDARSAYEHGVISRANETARRLGAESGLAARDVLERWARLPIG